MSNPLKSEFFCIADDDFLSIVDKLHANNLSEEDKKLIAHIMINPTFRRSEIKSTKLIWVSL